MDQILHNGGEFLLTFLVVMIILWLCRRIFLEAACQDKGEHPAAQHVFKPSRTSSEPIVKYFRIL